MIDRSAEFLYGYEDAKFLAIALGYDARQPGLTFGRQLNNRAT
jgi:hypothetical protein